MWRARAPGATRLPAPRTRRVSVRAAGGAAPVPPQPCERGSGCIGGDVSPIRRGAGKEARGDHLEENRPKHKQENEFGCRGRTVRAADADLSLDPKCDWRGARDEEEIGEPAREKTRRGKRLDRPAIDGINPASGEEQPVAQIAEFPQSARTITIPSPAERMALAINRAMRGSLPHPLQAASFCNWGQQFFTASKGKVGLFVIVRQTRP